MPPPPPAKEAGPVKPFKAIAIQRQEGHYVFVTYHLDPDTLEVLDVVKSNLDVKAIIAAKALDVVWRQASGDE